MVVDAAQGIEAQTLANVYLALDNDLEILPVINKIDLPAADPERVRTEVEDVIGLDASEAVLASVKAGYWYRRDFSNKSLRRFLRLKVMWKHLSKPLSLTLFMMRIVVSFSKCVWLTEWLNQAIRFNDV